MKKTGKVNVLKSFNDSKAAGYKKANSAMSAFKKSLRKAPNGGVVTEPPMIGPKTESQTIRNDIRNYQPPIPQPNRQDYVKVKENTYGSGSPGYRANSSKPKASNYKAEIQKRYGSANGEISPEDMVKLKEKGLLKKGGSLKRKK